MISIVSFDYFQPTEHIDFGFSEMEPWSENFDLLDYSSINFIDVMGSILISAILLILYVFVAAVSGEWTVQTPRFTQLSFGFDFATSSVGTFSALSNGKRLLFCLSYSVQGVQPLSPSPPLHRSGFANLAHGGRGLYLFRTNRGRPDVYAFWCRYGLADVRGPVRNESVPSG